MVDTNIIMFQLFTIFEHVLLYQKIAVYAH